MLGRDFIQGIDGNAEKIYTTNFTVSLFYNVDTSYLFVNGKEIILRPKILKLLHIHYV